MALDFEPLSAFLMELDQLKRVERRSYINGGERRENSAEHSWHVAMAAWALAGLLEREVSLEKLLKLALIHDLGEMEAGDTFIYAADRADAEARERAAIANFAGRHGGMIPDLEALWEEQEARRTPEARLLKLVDRLLPVMHNLASEGRSWREHDISITQVLEMHAFIADEAPEIFAWIEDQLNEAVAKGWLKP